MALIKAMKTRTKAIKKIPIKALLIRSLDCFSLFSSEPGSGILSRLLSLLFFLTWALLLPACLLFSETDFPHSDDSGVTASGDLDADDDLPDVGDEIDVDAAAADAQSDGDVVEANDCGGASPLSYE